MQELCFMTNVSGEQWAAWVQALGSIGAIVGSFWLARKFQLDEMRRLDFQNDAQAKLATQLREQELKRVSREEAGKDVQRYAIAAAALSYLKGVLEELCKNHGDRQLDVQQIAPIESSLAVPSAMLAQINLMELNDEAVAVALLQLLMVLRYAIDAGKSTAGFTVQKNFGPVVALCNKAMFECVRLKTIAEAKHAM